MKCPECIAEGERSTVTVGFQSTTAMWFPTRYDEDGNLMPTGRNKTATEYSCSRGHKWTETR